jgi:uncharacterized protein YjiS (DUF1127 family)
MRKSMPTINITNINGIFPHRGVDGHGLAAILRLAAHGLSSLSLMCGRSRQRRVLARLDDRMLNDIGYSRADALSEAAKPFWRP